jgi:hypothetical protein
MWELEQMWPNADQPSRVLDDTAMTTDYPQKITFGEMRASGVRDVLVYCRDHHCSHCVRISADLWPLVAPKNKSLARSNKTRMRVPC